MNEFFEIAQTIGARLCRDAIWSGDRCNWIGASMEAIGGWTVVQKSFGPDLYSGTSGIAILLAELASRNHERLFRKTAEAAVAQALSRAADIPSELRAGFYSGQAGIAYALVRVGESLGNSSLIDQGRSMMEGLCQLDVDRQGLDVISGVAGAIPALLLFDKKFRRQNLVDLALRCAGRLERTANKSDDGWSWKTIDLPGQDQRDLTGFSHGTAGIAWALLELGQATGEKRYLDAAGQGFRYERRWFSAEQENWPDFRNGMAPGQAAPSFGVAWCHGAPGIGLSRLRAYEVTRDAAFEQEAQAASRTTMRYVQMPQTAQAGFSLCHGAAGNAEFLLESSRVFQNAEYRQTAEQVGRQGISWFEKSRGTWPCGVLGGAETPNLLLGTAGIGMFYLRLSDVGNVRSVLLVGPDD
jgi:type 2 lantibiotic biosynthesis protein LanM